MLPDGPVFISHVRRFLWIILFGTKVRFLREIDSLKQIKININIVISITTIYNTMFKYIYI